MLSGKLVHVRMAKNKISPVFIDPESTGRVDLARRLIGLYEKFPGRTREEIKETLAATVGDSPAQIVEQGLAKLLEDRCEFETSSAGDPVEIRDALFRAAARRRQSDEGFDRGAVLAEAMTQLNLKVGDLESGMFADLKGEQHVTTFEPIGPAELLHRYNVSLVQALLLRATHMDVLISDEPPARLRGIMRVVKFHRLIAQMLRNAHGGLTIRVEGPMSLFQSTQKYGMQLANLLPHILHCRKFEITATVRWGPAKKDKTLAINDGMGLKSYARDAGGHLPDELRMFAESFAKSVDSWKLSDDPAIVPMGNDFWVPDFRMTPAGKVFEPVDVEILGFWRKGDAEAHYEKLRKFRAGKFVLALPESMLVDEKSPDFAPRGVYRFKRTPLPAEVVRVAEESQTGGNPR